MTAATGSLPMGAARVLQLQARITHHVVELQLNGITHAESLICPASGGNCLNWVVGHLLTVEGLILSLLNQQPAMEAGALARYERGAPALTNGANALDLTLLLTAWHEAAPRVDAGYAAISTERLASLAGFSPTGDPTETVGSLLTALSWHQSFHAGQAAILRRLAGKPGAIP